MRSKSLPLLCALLVVVVLLAILAVGGGEGADSIPPAPDVAGRAPESGVAAEAPPALDTVNLPMPREAALPIDDPDADEGDEEPSLAAGLARAAMAQLGPVLREVGDIEAFLDGRPVDEWKFVNVSPENRERLITLLATGDAKARFEAALALAVARLGPAEVVRLQSRFDAELRSMGDPASKNVVLALSFALHVHGDRHGVAALADAVRTGAHADVKGFRDGAVLVLAIARDPETAPLLRDLLLEDPERLVRKNAAVGLGGLGGEENWMALAESLVREEDVEVRAWSALSAGRAATEGADDEPLRRALAEDPAGEVRGAAAFALGQVEGAAAESTLESAFFSDGHPFARIGALAGIAANDEDGSARAFLTGQGAPWLGDLVRTSGDAVARFYAVTALAMLPPSADRSAGLRHAASEDGSRWVKLVAIDRLVETEGQGARPFLEERLAAEEAEPIRKHLQAAIERLGPASD